MKRNNNKWCMQTEINSLFINSNSNNNSVATFLYFIVRLLKDKNVNIIYREDDKLQ